MAKRKKKDRSQIDPNTLRIRDELLKRLICGATKAGVEKDHRKEENKKRCRKKVREES